MTAQNDNSGTHDETTRSETSFYGYRLAVVSAKSDGTYHDHATIRVEIRSETSDEVLHTVTTTTRSTHQLSKHHRPAADPAPGALIEAERWILGNRPDAVARQREEQAAAAERVRLQNRQRFKDLRGDALAYINSLSRTLSPTDAAGVLELGSTRRFNQYLVTWGLQRRQHEAYVPADPAHAEQVGFHGTLRWRASGLKAIWDAALQHGLVTGGDAEFVRRVRTHTYWFYGIADT